MTDALKELTAFISAIVALLGVTVSLLQLRERNRANHGDTNRRLAGRTFAWLARPAPILAGMTLLAVVSILLLVQLGEDTTEPPPTAARLLRQLVSKEAQECREQAPAPRAITALTCRLPKPMSTLRISLFASNADLKRTFQERLDATGVAKGECSEQRFAWEEWARGKLICDYGDARVRARFVWSRSDSQVLLEAEARLRANEYDIYRWWTREGNGAPANNRLPFPDRNEKYILDRKGLKARECERVTYGYKSSDAAVRCTEPSVDYLYLYYYSKAKALRSALHADPGAGSCTRSSITPGRQAYAVRGERAGIRQCWTSRDPKYSAVEWTNRTSLIYGYARMQSDTPDALDRLYRWWLREGRLLTD